MDKDLVKRGKDIIIWEQRAENSTSQGIFWWHLSIHELFANCLISNCLIMAFNLLSCKVYRVMAKTNISHVCYEKNRLGAMVANDGRMSPKREPGKIRKNFLEEFARSFYYMITSLFCLAPKYMLSVRDHTVLLSCYRKSVHSAGSINAGKQQHSIQKY